MVHRQSACHNRFRPYCSRRPALLVSLAVFILFIGCLSGCTWAPDPAEEARRRQAEWEERNAALKAKQGEYYVPLPPPQDEPPNPRVKVRGLYITGHTVGYPERYEQILDLVDHSELNALVIDVKDDSGKMSYRSEIEIINTLDAYHQTVPIADIRAILEDLHARGIYTIARIVVFKDNFLPTVKPEWCIPFKTGEVYRDNLGRGFAYGNPFQEEVWDYNIAIAKEAALLGFKEIQFDYIRFPDSAAYMETVAEYPGRNGRPKAEAIKGFIERAREELAPYNVYLAHDVFGVIANSWADSDDIGQIWEDFATGCDYICPMVYPSHYGYGYFGFPVPDANPAGTIKMSLSDAIKRNAPVKNPAVIRPWLQAFTATWIKGHIPYGAAEVRLQIDTALELGLEEYMIWNPGNVYPGEAFLGTAEAESRIEQGEVERKEKEYDFLNRSARDATVAYLEAWGKREWREAYALESNDGVRDGNRYRGWFNAARGRLQDWTIVSTKGAGPVQVNLNLTVLVDGEEHSLREEQWVVRRENDVWRVQPSSAFLALITEKAVAVEEEGGD